MFKRIAVLAALAAGTVLLTACDAKVSAGDANGTTVDVNPASGDTEDVETVDCGEVDVNGGTHTLVAVPANGGIVGCTEAFNVLDEYLTRGTATLSDSWACAPDDAAIACVKGTATDEDGLAFHTEAGGETLEPVVCGEVDVDGSTHTLAAESAADGVVGCTEAFNVIAEYLAIPVRERGASLNGTDLSNGWKCTTDDGEIAAIGCVKDLTGDDFRLAFSTTPASS